MNGTPGRAARVALGICDLFLGATAVYGGVLVIPTLPPEWLRGTPFPDWTLPQVALTGVGLVALAGAAGLVFRPRFGVRATALAGGTISFFEVVQVLSLSLGNWLGLAGFDFGNRVEVEGYAGTIHPALWLQPFYCALGLAMLFFAWRARRSTAPRTMRAAPRLSAGAATAGPRG
jgi:hypothetical protein